MRKSEELLRIVVQHLVGQPLWQAAPRDRIVAAGDEDLETGPSHPIAALPRKISRTILPRNLSQVPAWASECRLVPV
jgi:hypothetical protein